MATKLSLTKKANALEGSTNGTFIITLDAPAISDLTVNFNTTGTATLGTDYSFAKGSNLTALTANSFTILKGQTTATLNVAAIADKIYDPNETVNISLKAGSGYSLDSANSSSSLSITDANDQKIDFTTAAVGIGATYSAVTAAVATATVSAVFVSPTLVSFRGGDVADMPTLKVTTVNSGLHQVKLDISAALTDTDGSETLAIYLNGISPSSVKGVTGATWNAAISKYVVSDKTVTFDLPATGNSAFNPTVEAVAKESSNGDTAIKTELLSIKENNFSYTFIDNNQSMWGSNPNVHNEKVFGIDKTSTINGGMLAGTSLSYKLGLESTTDLKGGAINAKLPYDFSFDTVLDKTQDVLTIIPHAKLNKAYYETLSPELKTGLDLIAKANAHLKLSTPEVNLKIVKIPQMTILEKDFNVVGIDKNIVTIDTGKTYNVPGVTVTPLPKQTISTRDSGDSDNSITSTLSTDFVNLNLDVDKIISEISKIPLHFQDSGRILGLVNWETKASILDASLTGALKFVQKLQMDVKSLTGIFNFEDGRSQNIKFDTPNYISHASIIDKWGDKDGTIEFNSLLTPHAIMTNDTDLGIKADYVADALSASLHLESTKKFLGWRPHADFSEGPLIHLSGNIVNTSIDVFNQTFDMGVASQGFNMTA